MSSNMMLNFAISCEMISVAIVMMISVMIYMLILTMISIIVSMMMLTLKTRRPKKASEAVLPRASAEFARWMAHRSELCACTPAACDSNT